MLTANKIVFQQMQYTNKILVIDDSVYQLSSENLQGHREEGNKTIKQKSWEYEDILTQGHSKQKFLVRTHILLLWL